MEVTIETGKDGGYIITIGYDDNVYVRQTLNEVGELLEDAFGEEADFDDVSEDDEDKYTYRLTPFGIIRTKIVAPPTKEDWDAQQAVYAEKAAIAKAKRDAEAAAAELAEIEKIDALEKAAAAWRAKYPNKRRGETKPVEDPGEGFEWVMDEGICHCIWTRTKVGR